MLHDGYFSSPLSTNVFIRLIGNTQVSTLLSAVTCVFLQDFVLELLLFTFTRILLRLSRRKHDISNNYYADDTQPHQSFDLSEVNTAIDRLNSYLVDLRS